MTPRNRKTLTDNFTDGKMPSEEAFADLIHSMVNIVDDGIEKTARDGLKISQFGNGDRLVSFFDKVPVQEPLWSIGLSTPAQGGDAAGGQNLNVFSGNHLGTGLTLAAGKRDITADQDPTAAEIKLGVNNNSPEHAIDAEGVVASNGRIGREGGEEKRKVLADGEWHPIITGLDGCQAFEIMAGVGKPGSGKYALLHAFALSTFNSKKGNITRHQAYYSSKCDQIDLRWAGSPHSYALEMRTRCSFLKKNAGKDERKDEIYIRYYVTQLWFDSFMDGCMTVPSDPKRKVKSEARREPEEETGAEDRPAGVPRRERRAAESSFLARLRDALNSILARRK